MFYIHVISILRFSEAKCHDKTIYLEYCWGEKTKSNTNTIERVYHASFIDFLSPAQCVVMRLKDKKKCYLTDLSKEKINCIIFCL